MSVGLVTLLMCHLFPKLTLVNEGVLPIGTATDCNTVLEFGRGLKDRVSYYMQQIPLSERVCRIKHFAGDVVKLSLQLIIGFIIIIIDHLTPKLANEIEKYVPIHRQRGVEQCKEFISTASKELCTH